MTRPAIELSLQRAAEPIPVSPGEMITIAGSLYSSHDGSTIDAATTTWPDAAPGGASVDSGGLIDFDGGGFALVSRNGQSHVVTAVATGKAAPRCTEHGVSAPCLLLRTSEKAHSRLLTVEQYVATLKGGLRVEGAALAGAPELQGAAARARAEAGPSPLWAAGGALFGAVAVALALLALWRRWSTSAGRRLRRQIRQLGQKARRLDPVLAAVLVPELGRVQQAVHKGRLDPASADGRRVADALGRLESDLDESSRAERTQREKHTADALVQQLHGAVLAAVEAGGGGAQALMIMRSTNQ